MRDPDDVADPSYVVSGRRRIHRKFLQNYGTTVNQRSETPRKPSLEKEVSRPTISPVDGGVRDQKVKHVWSCRV
ncbi:hypothetical protein Hanom_Chr03g00269631 [Helianthus anomalus]